MLYHFQSYGVFHNGHHLKAGVAPLPDILIFPCIPQSKPNCAWPGLFSQAIYSLCVRHYFHSCSLPIGKALKWGAHLWAGRYPII